MSIPEKLYSDKTGKPFENCSVCGEAFKDQLHFVEKAYHRNLGDDAHSVIFEYAICENCKREMLREVSQESMMRMQQFMMEHQEELDEMRNAAFDLNECSFTGQKLNEMDEFHVVAVIRNGKTEMSPIVFGLHIMEVYQNLLSEKTKEFFDDFYDDFIDIPPELAKILDRDIKPVML